MAKRKTLPKDFEQLVQTASDEDIKKVLGKCDINAYGGYNKGNALEFPLSEEMMRWLIEQGIDINYVDQYGYTPLLYHAPQPALPQPASSYLYQVDNRRMSSKDAPSAYQIFCLISCIHMS